MRLSVNLIICGFKGSGKTYLGKKLSLFLEKDFIDLDECILKKNSANSISSLYKTIEEKKFREIESEILLSLKDKTDCVLSLGGGAIIDEKNKQFLKNFGKIIYLKEEKTILKNRILTPPFPAFLDLLDLESSFEKLFLLRTKMYESFADIQIDAKNLKNFIELHKDLPIQSKQNEFSITYGI
jgi:shikimate kinase